MTRLLITLTLAFGFLWGNANAADLQSGNDRYAAIVQRLDRILERLDAIEHRLAQLELESLLASDSWVDRRGVIRTEDGRPIGFWGIDGPVKVRLR